MTIYVVTDDSKIYKCFYSLKAATNFISENPVWEDGVMSIHKSVVELQESDGE